MSLLTIPNSWGWRLDNFGTCDTTPGTSVAVSGTANTEGTFTKLLNGSAIVADVFGVELLIHNYSGSNQERSLLVDIGIIEDDGADSGVAASVTAIISNIVAGCANTIDGINRVYCFPIRIPVNASIWVRGQSSYGTSANMVAAIRVVGRPSRPEAVWTGRISETIGSITNSSGVTITPGTATFSGNIGTSAGDWHSLGTTSYPLHHWNLCAQLTQGTQTGEASYWELGYGDGSNVVPIIEKQYFYSTSSERNGFIGSPFSGYCSVPSGATMYIRAQTENAPDTTYNAVAVGIG